VECKICSEKTELFARNTILGKYDVDYFRCRGCGFIQTEEPFWLEDAYSEAITSTDVGLVSRNIDLARVTATLITLINKGNGRFLDYGGGYGLLTRMMRDYGYNFHWHDKHCQNIFARSFEDDGESSYDLLTAYEVIEHLVSPLDELVTMRKRAPVILLTTNLLPADQPKPGHWWYYGLDHGQHISIFTKESLRIAAEKIGLKVVSWGAIHFLSARAFPKIALRASTFQTFNSFFRLIFKNKSLLESDYHLLLNTKKINTDSKIGHEY